MPTIITNYTTYDLAYYYADTKRLPHLSKEEEQSLIASLAPATAQQLPMQQIIRAKQRLIEGYLGLASCIAIDLCPRSRRAQLFPDLVQEANLALVLATNRFDWRSGGNFTAYVAAWMRGKVKKALSDDRLVKIDAAARERARQEGTLEQWYALQHPMSLDRLLDEDDPDSSTLELLQAPPTQPASPRDEHKRAQVEALLAYLSPRAQTILRLRYGLLDDDERPYTESEIARALGISRAVVQTTEHDAMQRLRALVAGQATISRRNGKLCISLPGCRTPTLSPERQALLIQAYSRLEAESIPITARLLAQETGLPGNITGVFLRQQRGEHAASAQRKETRRQARLLRLEEAYAQLEAAGKTPSGRALARAARVAKPAALAFLRTRRQRQETARDTPLAAAPEGDVYHV
jgi:RNA polymerase sigma factor (sigma-70 family)